MSCFSEIYCLRKRYNVTPSEISCSVRKLKKSNGAGRRFPWFVKKQEAQNTIDVRREIPPGCESQEMQAPIDALIRDFLDLCKGRRVCYVG